MAKHFDEYVAHVARDIASNLWKPAHLLPDHLEHTANFASEFAIHVGEDWARLAGRWHDIGKFGEWFQEYIRCKSGYERENAHIESAIRRPHSTAGAIHAIEMLPSGLGHILAYIIAGHHAGLPNWEDRRSCLRSRLAEGQKEYEQAIKEDIPKTILEGKCPPRPPIGKSQDSISLWIRMLFSCLVDADFLDTESYMNPEKTIKRKSNETLTTLHTRFNNELDKLLTESEPTQLNSIRKSVLNDCINAGKLDSGIFSLTVPTGGGKTLSSLAFAFEHAKIHNKDRIIYAIPFTSIIEQNADEFRRYLGDDAVLEHHSNLDVKANKENSRQRLAAENWDSPLIVTTNVQLFESLHAAKTSRCRKLHNIVNSVIILDEAQQFPRDFHAPITHMMQLMADHFGVTWVLCTATQPVLSRVEDNFGQVLIEGLNNVREIISSPVKSKFPFLMKRVEVKMPTIEEQKLSWEQLGNLISQQDCVLVIVNTRKHAHELFNCLPDDDNNLHLSANMCPEHRSEIIKIIKTRLKERLNSSTRPIRVISTQLIEAGVDLDFPVVYRAMTGLDSIAQSAGRCNREGKLKQPGKVIVFKPEDPSPKGFLRQAEDTTYELISGNLINNPLAPESFEKYFSLLNAKGERDKHDILGLLKAWCSNDVPLGIQFRDAAEKFRLIDDKGTPIIVPFVPQNAKASPIYEWLEILEQDPSQKWVYRKLQRYSVTLPESVVNNLIKQNCINICNNLFVLSDIEIKDSATSTNRKDYPIYDPRWGIDMSRFTFSGGVSVI